MLSVAFSGTVGVQGCDNMQLADAHAELLT